jgi:hypothetical protein
MRLIEQNDDAVDMDELQKQQTVEDTTIDESDKEPDSDIEDDDDIEEVEDSELD